jgi:hypothetical protein
MAPHYEKRIVHGAEMLVEICPPGRAVKPSRNSRYRRRDLNSRSLREAEEISEKRFPGCKSPNTKTAQKR